MPGGGYPRLPFRPNPARQGKGRAVSQELQEVLIFEVGSQRYGLPAAGVRELVRAVTVTPLPRAPAIVEGVIDLRGTIVPVLDIRARFRLPAKPPEPPHHL